MQYLLILLFGIALAANAQPPDSVWSWTYGGESHDDAQRVIRTSSGSWLIAGTVTDSDWLRHVALAKLTVEGDTIWTRVYSIGNVVGGMVPTSDDGCIATTYGGGSTYGAGSTVMRIDANGNILWSYAFDYVTYGFNWAPAICRAESSDVIVCGVRWFPIDATWGVEEDQSFCIRLSVNGDSIWCRLYDLQPGSSTIPLEVPRSVISAPGGYAFCGDAGSGVLIAGVNTSGYLQWSNVFPRDEGYVNLKQIVSAGNGFLCVGTREGDSTSSQQIRLLKTEATGNYEWHRDYGGVDFEQGNCLLAINDDFLLAGWTRSFGSGGTDCWLVRVNSSGDSLWSRTYGGTDHESCSGLFAEDDGSGIVVGAVTPEQSSNSDWLAIGLEFEQGTLPFCRVPRYYSLAQNYPNPFNASTAISFDLPREELVRLIVFDITGRIVATMADKVTEAGAHQVRWDASRVPSGVYIYRLENGSFTQSRKMVVLK